MQEPGKIQRWDRVPSQVAWISRAGELVVVRIPSEAKARVGDVVRCRDTFKREMLESRRDLLTFLVRRGSSAAKAPRPATVTRRRPHAGLVDRRSDDAYFAPFATPGSRPTPRPPIC